MHEQHKKLIKYGKFLLSNVPEFFVFQFYVSKYKDQYAHKCPLCMGVKLGQHMMGRPQTQQNAQE
jgi:hypothetical protein